MADDGAPDSKDEDMIAPVEKPEHVQDGGSTSSISSSPDADPETFPQEHPQTQKRKGGRKPIYATSEERKQRNRQAQAAFRERRTEYIKQLETTIKQHEESLKNLQASHRTAADECLLLRYKNSLLERILIEKGINVNQELQAKGSPNFGPHQGPPTASAPVPHPQSQSPMQRAMMNRHHARRSGSHMNAKTEAAGLPPDGMLPNPSPRLQPAPTTHASSPAIGSTRSPNFLPQGGMTSPTVGSLAQQQQHMRSPQPHRPPYTPMQPTPPQRPHIITAGAGSNGPLSSGISSAGSGMSSGISAGPSSYYPSPFRSHMDQLEQEYDAQADMYDDQDPSDQSAGPGPYPYGGQQMSPHGLPPTSNPGQQAPGQHFTPQPPQENQQPSNDSNVPVFPPPNHSFDAFDPMLDADPFGLTASMHFPTPFSYESR